MPAMIPPAEDEVPFAPVSELSDRIAERDRAARRVFWRRVAILAVGAAALVALVWAAFFSPLFALAPERVVVSAAPGNVDIAAVENAANARVGTPLPRLRTGSLRAELEAVPTVLSAEVRREWPDGLSVEVVPRTPIAAVPADSGFELFDTYGVDLGFVPDVPEGVPVAQIPLGEDTAFILDGVTAVMGSLPPELLGQISTVSASSQDAIEFMLDSGATVRWGDNSGNELKAAVLDTLLAEVKASFYDVSSPRNPITS
ncbi:MAG TPA: FtsQ-type POTRA domain-containing protein [Actinomycetaceae bacterium]|nr:FtsQ-type POTRA domain-containing protein [Actinomycetaceae bacterium]